MSTPYLRKKRAEFVKEMEMNKDSLLEKYVTKIDGKLIVNWKGLMEYKHSFLERASEGVEPVLYHQVLRYLEYKGILSLKDEGNFITFAEGLNMGPIASMHYYKFTRRHDAEEYAKVESAYEKESIKVAKVLSSKKK